MFELNRIYNEDCLLTMEKMGRGVDVVLTSPPYNMSKRRGGVSDTGRYDVYVDWKSEDEYIAFTVNVFNSFNKVVVDNGVVLYNFSYSIENPSLPYKLVTKLEEETEWMLADTIIWKKHNGMPFPANERRLSRIWEFIFVFVRKNEINTYKVNKGVSKVSKKGQKYYNVFYNLIESQNNDAKTRTLNQATFSTELCCKLLRIYGFDGCVVYDPFMGTGTTGNACIIMNMKYIGSEISEAQCKYAEERIRKTLSIFVNNEQDN